MTEKFAKVKADGSGSSVSFQINHGDEKVSSLAGNHEKPTHRENTAAKGVPNSQLLLSSSRDQQEDRDGKRKAVIGFGEANTFGNDEVKTSRKKLSLALPPQSQKKDLLCGEEHTNGGVSAACKENKKPKKLSLGLKQPFNDNLASTSFRTSGAKSDNNRLSRKLSLRPLGESNEVNKTEVLAQTDMELEMNQNEDERSWRGEFENSVLEETSMPESIVVLDSDDSGDEEEEEIVSSRSRLSLARRRGLKCSRP